MKRFFMLVTIASLSCLGAVGCDKKVDAPPAPNEGAKQADEKPATLTDDDLPVKSDFVEEAEAAITKESYKSELDKLATEIEAD
jgi:hypothetical protein